MSGPLSYDVPGATRPADATWGRTPRGHRRRERTVRLGQGDVLWTRASTEVLRWGVKTRSGFTVASPDGRPAGEVEPGADLVLTAHLGPLRVREPVRVVEVVRRPDRVGFAYGTRPGHPIAGEEAFVVHRDPDGTVLLTLRSLARPAPGRWRPVFPVLLVVQRVYLRRYARALVGL